MAIFMRSQNNGAITMMPGVRIYTGKDGQSHVDKVSIPLDAWTSATDVRFQESPPGSSFEWHNAPCRQYVVTLAGELEFTTRDGEKFILKPGDVLLAEDTAGSGHRWRLINDQPWRRVYIKLQN